MRMRGAAKAGREVHDVCGSFCPENTHAEHFEPCAGVPRPPGASHSELMRGRNKLSCSELERRHKTAIESFIALLSLWSGIQSDRRRPVTLDPLCREIGRRSQV